MKDLYEHVNPKNKKPSPLISKETYDIITKHEDVSGHYIKDTLQ
jgi:ribonucleoside-diphosphate reductase subunit M1